MQKRLSVETSPTWLANANSLLMIDTAVIILETNDIVLAEIVATLHFNHHQVYDSRVHQAVLMASTNKGGLIGVQHQLLLVVDDLCHPADDNPVLASVVMHL